MNVVRDVYARRLDRMIFDYKIKRNLDEPSTLDLYARRACTKRFKI